MKLLHAPETGGLPIRGSNTPAQSSGKRAGFGQARLLEPCKVPHAIIAAISEANEERGRDKNSTNEMLLLFQVSKLLEWAKDDYGSLEMRIENPERTLAAYDMLLEKGLDYPAHKFLEFVSMDVFGNWKWNDFIEGLTRRPGSSRMLQALFLKIVADAISDPFLARDRDKKTTGALAALVKAGRFEDLHHVAVGIAKLREEEMLQVGAIAMHSNWDNKNFARSAIISWVEFQLQKAGRGDLAGIVADAAYDNGVSYIEPASAEKWEPTNEEKAEMGKIIRVIVECANNCKDNTLQIERSIGAHGLKKVKGAAINLIENKENADFSNYSGDDGAGFAPATVRSIALAARKVFLEQGHIPESDEIWDAWNANSPQGRME